MQRASGSSPSTPKSSEPPSKRQRMSTDSSVAPSPSAQETTRGEKELERQAAALGETKWALSVRPLAQATTSGLRVVDASWADLSSSSPESDDGKEMPRLKSTPGRFAFGKKPQQDGDGSDKKGRAQHKSGVETDSGAESFSDTDVLGIFEDSKSQSNSKAPHEHKMKKNASKPWTSQQPRALENRQGRHAVGQQSRKPKSTYANEPRGFVPTCATCGARGHTERDCPRRAGRSGYR